MTMETFRDLGLSERSLKEIDRRGFEEPTEIQKKIIPLLLSTEGDIIGQAQTGTGKTAAFGLPIIERIDEKAGHVQALILTPTRELAVQVSEELNSFKGARKLQIIPVYGGQSMVEQFRRLKSGVDVVVGTPGRIIDHIKRKSLVLDRLSFAVLDEADEMLNMGFLDEVEEILGSTNPDKRTLLFSATMPPHIREIARRYMKEHVLVSTRTDKLTVEQTDQIYFEVNPADRLEALCRIVDLEQEFYGLVFCRTKVEVDELASKLMDRGYDAEGLHGDFNQTHRERTLEKFRKRRINILVATDVAARGIDISDLTHVINYSLPQDPEAYIHRIGRTGRAGKKGVAVTFVSPSEYRKLSNIVRVTKTEIRKEKIPAVAEIISAKEDRIASELRNIMLKGEHQSYLKTVGRLVGEEDPREVLAALLHYTLRDELSRSQYSEIREISVDRKGTARLFVSMGSQDGLTTRKLLRIISKESGVKADTLSEVTIKDTFSSLTAPFREAEIILKAFGKGHNPTRLLIRKMDKGGAGKGREGGSGEGRGRKTAPTAYPFKKGVKRSKKAGGNVSRLKPGKKK